MQGAALNACQVSDREMGSWFAANLQQRPTENSCLMAMSTLRVLDLLHTGTAGETSTRLDSLRNRVGIPAEATLQLHQDVLHKLQAVQVEYKQASALVVHKDWRLSERAADAAIMSETKIAQFTSPDDALRQVNGLVNETTDGKIPAILNSMPSDAVVVAVSATLLDGHFNGALDYLGGCKDTFLNADGTQTEPSYHFWLGEAREYPATHFGGPNLNVRVINLPCWGGISLTLFKSTDATNWKSSYAALAEPANWSRLCDWIYSADKDVAHWKLQVPGFNMECQTDFLSTFKDHPTVAALVDTNFNPSWVTGSGEPVRLAAFVDKHTFELNEAGFTMTGACAAVGHMECFRMPPDYPAMKFDHTFGFVVAHNESKVLLGAGLVANIQAE